MLIYNYINQGALREGGDENRKRTAGANREILVNGSEGRDASECLIELCIAKLPHEMDKLIFLDV